MRTTSNSLLAAALAIIFNCPGAPAAEAAAGQNPPAPERGFVSSRPAQRWEDALISGNGKLGTMVLGQPRAETIILTHARLFMPLNQPLPPVDTASHLGEIRQMLSNGEYQRAADYVVDLSHQEGWGGKRWTDPFIPAFDLKATLDTQGEVKNYSRSVDFATGVAAVHWTDDRGAFSRRLFVSRPDDVVVLSITGPGKGSVNCRLQLAQRPATGQGGWGPEQAFRDGIKDVLIGASGHWLTYRSSFRRNWPGSLQGYEGAARVFARGGTTTVEGAEIVVRGADEVTVLARIEPLTQFDHSEISKLERGLDALKPDFRALLARHAKVHGGLFNRERLDLGGDADRGLTSEELIAKSHVGDTAKTLVEKEFDAARYAVISSSGELFPNLQGIWNGTWGPPWSADFTLNGNVETAIAGDLSGNLVECLLPFFGYLESHMADYRENARRLYGCRGIDIPSRASTHGLNNHFDGTWPMTFWTAGAGWAAHFFYDYYLYTGDRAFLRQRALPFMKEAALFYEDFLVAGPDGKLLFSPSYSPENDPANTHSQACINATMDIAVARELLKNCIAASEKLNTDGESVERWKAMLVKMPDYQINADGVLKEWATPLLEDHYEHRHASHLYALFYGLPPEIAADTNLCVAFDRAIEKRMAYRRREPSGEMAFGVVQLAQASASLHKAATCSELLDWLVNLYWSPALTSTHNAHSLFNTDICGGLPDVITRLLVDSQPGRIELLPAVPAQWPSGKIEGVPCRGQVEVIKLEWDPQRISVTLKSAIKQTVKLSAEGGPGEQLVKLGKGAEITLRIDRLKGPAGQKQRFPTRPLRPGGPF